MTGKRGWVAKDFIVGMLVFVLITSLMYLMTADLSSNYDNQNVINTSFSSHYGQVATLDNKVSKMWNASTGPKSLTPVGTVLPMLQMVFTVIPIIFDSMGIVSNVFVNFGNDFGVPSQISGLVFPLLLMILSVIIIFVVINATKYGVQKV